MTQHFDICIRGAGIVGRTLALQLAARQLHVALVAAAQPQSPTRADDVRAYALNQLSRDLLESVRCWPGESHATPVHGMDVQAPPGGRVGFSAAEQRCYALNWIVDVPILEEQLEQAVRFQPLIAVCDSPQSATLTIICEGRASATRQEFGVQWDAKPYGQSALATRVLCDQAHGQTARQWFDRGEILAFLPLDGASGRHCAIVWSVSPERARQLQECPATEFCEALQAASHSALGALTLTSARATWPLQHAMAQRWIGRSGQGAWALAGDAAHAIHPLAGQGLNLGLADVAELVRILTDKPYWRTLDDARLLRQYERSRKTALAVLGQANDTLQQIFTEPSTTWQSLRNWGMNQFERSGSIKQWVARQAMGQSATSSPLKIKTP
jgi:2-polyprenyl-6-methoxyphenol hydroxylase-like FAD-dependent oxidoreductase